MKIALITRESKVTKEATHITAGNFTKELSRYGEITVISDKKVSAFLSKIKAQQHTFDIIHNFSASPLFALKTILAKRYQKNAKTVHTLKSYSRSAGGSLYFSRILNLVDAITVPTQVMAEKLLKQGVKKEKIHIIRSHIDTTKFIPLDKQELKEKYGYPKQKVVLYYGSTYFKKGLQSLVQGSRLIDTQIIIAPRDYPNQEFFNSVKDKPNIKVITDDINVVEYVNLADIIVLPYLDLTATEGNPSCLLEAMACKTPIVTSDLPELREIVEPEKEVLMAKPGDVASLAFQINRLLKNPQLGKKLAENAYSKSKQFDTKPITKQFLGLYNRLSNIL
ncbi:MAG: glycosyltransferase [Nanoarchaeota archaeon]|nr:glycosyltransferase [Nanoarchaeota archaeon]